MILHLLHLQKKKKWNKKRKKEKTKHWRFFFASFFLRLRLWAGPICLRDTSNFPMTDDKISTFLVSYSDKRQSWTTFNSFFFPSVRLRFFFCSFGFLTFASVEFQIRRLLMLYGMWMSYAHLSPNNTYPHCNTLDRHASIHLSAISTDTRNLKFQARE